MEQLERITLVIEVPTGNKHNHAMTLLQALVRVFTDAGTWFVRLSTESVKE